jgi:site-specific DNA recombinase
MGKVFAYTRVSTVKQGEKGVSLEEQKDAIMRYASQRDLPIIRWFEELESAAKKGRPAFTQMLKLLRLNAAEGVIMHKIDRSARNLEDWADVGRLADAGVAIHFANERVDLATVSGRLSADIQAVVAAHFSRNLREETKKGIYGRLKQGFYPLRAPTGYLDVGTAKPKTPDPKMAPLVKEMFELYDSGAYSMKALMRLMKAKGLRSRSGGAVSLNGVSTILNNPFYIGIMRIKKTGQNFAGNHVPLISAVLFERVQARLRGKTVDRVMKHSFLFSRLARCGSCRYSLIGEKKKGHTYYRCHNRPFKTPPVCPKTILREERLDAAVESRLAALILSKAEVALVRGWAAEQRIHRKAAAENERRNAKMQLEAIRTRLSRLTDLMLDGVLEKSAFEEKQKELLKSEVQFRQQLLAFEESDDRSLTEVEHTVELASDALLLYKKANATEKRELLGKLLSNLTVTAEKVDMELKTPFHFIAERAKSSYGVPYRVTCRTTLEYTFNQIHRHIIENGPLIQS